MNQKVLILGGSYFVGKKIALFLNENGYHVTILNRGTKAPLSEDIEQIICDRGDEDGMKKVLKDKLFDHVIDISWKNLSWVQTVCSSINFDSVKTFIFLSSSAVYDVEHLSAPYRENDPLGENKYWTSYGKGKIEAEEYYQRFFATNNTNLIILRPPFLYGEDNYAQRESFIFKQICDNQPVIIPKSNPKLQFLYTGDLAQIVKFFLHRRNEKTEIFNVGNTKPMTAREWVQACAETVGQAINIVEYDHKALNKNVRDFFPFYDYDNVLDIQKAKSVFSKETSFATGLVIAYHWFCENRTQLVFNANVEKNIHDIISQINT